MKKLEKFKTKLYYLHVKDTKTGREDVFTITVAGTGDFQMLPTMGFLGKIRPEKLLLAHERSFKDLKKELKEAAPRYFRLVVDENSFGKYKYEKIKIKSLRKEEK